MPKATFMNLPDTKKRAVLDTAAVEFSEYPLEQASLSRIVARLGIAKGSMYQYFENKKDLYTYVLAEAYQCKRTYLDPVWQQDLRFFDQVGAYYKATFQFSVDHPIFHRMIHQFWNSRDQSIQDQIRGGLSQRELDFERMLRQAQEQRLVDVGILPETAFFVYHSVGRRLIDDFQHVGEERMQEHLSFIEQVFKLLELGMKSRKEGVSNETAHIE